jgi:hypothetical protein
MDWRKMGMGYTFPLSYYFSFWTGKGPFFYFSSYIPSLLVIFLLEGGLGIFRRVERDRCEERNGEMWVRR